MRGGLDDDQLAVDEHRSGRLVQIAGERGDLVGVRVVAAHRAVVGVEDRERAVGEQRDAERVLQPGGLRRPVDVAEVEQALADHGVQRAVDGQIAQRRGLGVDEPEPVAVDGEPGRLGQPAVAGRPVPQSLDGRAGEHLGGSGGRVDREQQVHPGRGDDELADRGPPGDVPRREHGGDRAGDRARVAQLVREVDGVYERAVGEPDAAQQMVRGVGDEHVAVELGEPVGFGEAQRLVGAAARAVADAAHDRVAVEFDELVMAGIGDHQVP